MLTEKQAQSLTRVINPKVVTVHFLCIKHCDLCCERIRNSFNPQKPFSLLEEIAK